MDLLSIVASSSNQHPLSAGRAGILNVANHVATNMFKDNKVDLLSDPSTNNSHSDPQANGDQTHPQSDQPSAMGGNIVDNGFFSGMWKPSAGIPER